MPNSGPDCCCSKCGVTLPPGTHCCTCVCDALCVTVTGIGTSTVAGEPCDCTEVITKVDWDSDECAYIGSVECGSSTVDVRFDVKYCDTGCYLCLTSLCLGLTGVCADGTGTGTGSNTCQRFTEGQDNDCGNYLKDCDQTGGWDESWSVDGSECAVGTANDCNELLISVTCYPRVNPAGSGDNRVCKDCDCVCDCVTITYEEPSFVSTEKFRCWGEGDATGTADDTDDGWVATFASPVAQTVTVTFERGDDDGCCYWRVAVSNGDIVGGTAAGTAESYILIKTACPDASISVDVDLGDENTGMVDIVCGPCAEPTTTDCCCELLNKTIHFGLSATCTPFGGAPTTYWYETTLSLIGAPNTESCNQNIYEGFLYDVACVDSFFFCIFTEVVRIRMACIFDEVFITLFCNIANTGTASSDFLIADTIPDTTFGKEIDDGDTGTGSPVATCLTVENCNTCQVYIADPNDSNCDCPTAILWRLYIWTT